MPFIPEESEVVKTVCNLNQCTGCMSCINLCSQNAISVKDSFLAYNAVIDLNKCVNCGLCQSRCPQNLSMGRSIHQRTIAVRYKNDEVFPSYDKNVGYFLKNS